MNKRPYRKPKWGYGLPGVNPRPNSPAAKRQRIPRASDRRTEHGAARWGGGILGHIISKMLYKLNRKRRQRMRPPDVAKDYTVNVK